MTASQPCVSIIVNLFNAEKTLRRCVDSALAQTLKDIEIILVDDGSTDGSPAICDSYSLSDSRVKVFHLPHVGLCPARQHGLDQASGEYLIFLDADDHAEPEMYGTLYSTAKEQDADMVFCDWIVVDGNDKSFRSMGSPDRTAESLLRDFLTYHPAYLWNTLIRKEFYEKQPVRLSSWNITYGEDTLFLVGLLSGGWNKQDFRIAIVNTPLYYYEVSSNASSLMKMNSADLNQRRVDVWKELIDLVDMARFGTTHYNRLVYLAYSALRDRLYDENDFRNLFLPYADGIRECAQPCLRKRIVLQAIDRGYRHATVYVLVGRLSEFVHRIVR